MIAQITLGARQRMASVILDVAFLAFHRVVGVMHLVHLLLIAVRVGLLLLLLMMLLLLLLDLLMLQLLMKRRQALIMLVHWRVGKIVRR